MKSLSQRKLLVLLFLVAICILITTQILFVMRRTTPAYEELFSEPVRNFIIKCSNFCKELDWKYSFSTLQLLKNENWCLSSLDVYDKNACATSDFCYVQSIGEKCNLTEKQFSYKYPEVIKLNCSFHLVTGELCNPDAIEDGWIKCCENPSLENCNCK